MRDFIDLFTVILVGGVPRNYCAVQYGHKATPISSLTSNMTQFITQLRRTERVGGFVSNITAGLEYISSQLHGTLGDANKVIYLGDGLENIPLEESTPARELLNPDNIDISAIAFGEFSISALTEITGDRNKIFRRNDFFIIAEALILLSRNVCGLSS